MKFAAKDEFKIDFIDYKFSFQDQTLSSISSYAWTMLSYNSIHLKCFYHHIKEALMHNKDQAVKHDHFWVDSLKNPGQPTSEFFWFILKLLLENEQNMFA